MIFNEHLELKGKHAPFAPSTPHWLKYDEDRLITNYISSYSMAIGTALHELAAELITLKEKLTKSDKKFVSYQLRKQGFDKKLLKRYLSDFYPMFSAYVNDAIELGLEPEVVLYYSDLFFGTSDAINYFEKDHLLRIHDLKTGVSPAKMEQLEVYAALYCLEYKVDPLKITFELRIYQGEDVLVHTPDPATIRQHCDTIVRSNKILKQFMEG